MKISKILFILFFSGGALSAYSQKATQVVSKEICDCFNTIDLKAAASVVEEKAQSCILTGIVNHTDELIKEYKIDPSDESAGEKIGNKLGKRLVKDCPTAVSVFTIMSSEEESGEGGEKAQDKKEK